MCHRDGGMRERASENRRLGGELKFCIYHSRSALGAPIRFVIDEMQCRYRAFRKV